MGNINHLLTLASPLLLAVILMEVQVACSPSDKAAPIHTDAKASQKRPKTKSTQPRQGVGDARGIATNPHQPNPNHPPGQTAPFRLAQQVQTRVLAQRNRPSKSRIEGSESVLDDQVFDTTLTSTVMRPQRPISQQRQENKAKTNLAVEKDPSIEGQLSSTGTKTRSKHPLWRPGQPKKVEEYLSLLYNFALKSAQRGTKLTMKPERKIIADFNLVLQLDKMAKFAEQLEGQSASELNTFITRQRRDPNQLVDPIEFALAIQQKQQQAKQKDFLFMTSKQINFLGTKINNIYQDLAQVSENGLDLEDDLTQLLKEELHEGIAGIGLTNILRLEKLTSQSLTNQYVVATKNKQWQGEFGILMSSLNQFNLKQSDGFQSTEPQKKPTFENILRLHQILAKMDSSSLNYHTQKSGFNLHLTLKRVRTQISKALLNKINKSQTVNEVDATASIIEQLLVNVKHSDNGFKPDPSKPASEQVSLLNFAAECKFHPQMREVVVFKKLTVYLSQAFELQRVQNLKENQQQSTLSIPFISQMTIHEKQLIRASIKLLEEHSSIISSETDADSASSVKLTAITSYLKGLLTHRSYFKEDSSKTVAPVLAYLLTTSLERHPDSNIQSVRKSLSLRLLEQIGGDDHNGFQSIVREAIMSSSKFTAEVQNKLKALPSFRQLVDKTLTGQGLGKAKEMSDIWYSVLLNLQQESKSLKKVPKTGVQSTQRSNELSLWLTNAKLRAKGINNDHFKWRKTQKTVKGFIKQLLYLPSSLLRQIEMDEQARPLYWLLHPLISQKAKSLQARFRLMFDFLHSLPNTRTTEANKLSLSIIELPENPTLESTRICSQLVSQVLLNKQALEELSQAFEMNRDELMAFFNKAQTHVNKVNLEQLQINLWKQQYQSIQTTSMTIQPIKGRSRRKSSSSKSDPKAAPQNIYLHTASKEQEDNPFFQTEIFRYATQVINHPETKNLKDNIPITFLQVPEFEKPEADENGLNHYVHEIRSTFLLADVLNPQLNPGELVLAVRKYIEHRQVAFTQNNAPYWWVKNKKVRDLSDNQNINAKKKLLQIGQYLPSKKQLSVSPGFSAYGAVFSNCLVLGRDLNSARNLVKDLWTVKMKCIETGLKNPEIPKKLYWDKRWIRDNEETKRIIVNRNDQEKLSLKLLFDLLSAQFAYLTMQDPSMSLYKRVYWKWPRKQIEKAIKMNYLRVAEDIQLSQKTDTKEKGRLQEDSTILQDDSTLEVDYKAKAAYTEIRAETSISKLFNRIMLCEQNHEFNILIKRIIRLLSTSTNDQSKVISLLSPVYMDLLTSVNQANLEGRYIFNSKFRKWASLGLIIEAVSENKRINIKKAFEASPKYSKNSAAVQFWDTLDQIVTPENQRTTESTPLVTILMRQLSFVSNRGLSENTRKSYQNVFFNSLLASQQINPYINSQAIIEKDSVGVIDPRSSPTDSLGDDSSLNQFNPEDAFQTLQGKKMASNNAFHSQPFPQRLSGYSPEKANEEPAPFANHPLTPQYHVLSPAATKSTTVPLTPKEIQVIKALGLNVVRIQERQQGK